jgi:hypothetical protein
MSRPAVWAKKKKKAGGAGFQGPSWQANWMDAAMTQKGAPGESHTERERAPERERTW